MNKTYSIITGRIRITAIAGLVSLGVGAAQAALVQEEFDSYSNGDLGGQGGWAANPDAATYSQAQVIDGTGVNTSKVISNTTDTKAGFMTKGVSLDWTSYDTAVLSIDIYRGSGSSIGTWAGFYTAGTMRGYGIRVETAAIAFRSGATGGDRSYHTDIDGNDINIQNDKWYRISYEFSPADNQITKAMLYNLTDGGATQLYFGAITWGNTVTATEGYTPESTANPLNWNQMVVLTGRSTAGTVMFDNISVIPEPATIGMMLLGSIGALALRRIRG